MGRLIDETGNTYGYLTVIERAKENSKDVKWLCKCKCGNEVIVRGSSLRNGNTKSCGCLQKEKIRERNENKENIIGKKFNHLLVEKFVGYKENNNGKRSRLYECLCDCGNKKITTYNYIISGQVKSCGCLSHKKQYIDEIGNRYGKLTVLSYEGTNKDKRSLWLCKCDCGGTIITSGKSLRNGLIISCGCVKSKGEEKISKLLEENNINYSKQWHFKDLKSKNNYPLYFDFAIFDENNKLKCLIEYQGEQHYNEPRGKWTSIQETDAMKKNYCKNNKIKLIEIPYYNYEKLNWEFLKEMI